jgi:hypothetical protein
MLRANGLFTKKKATITVYSMEEKGNKLEREREI